MEPWEAELDRLLKLAATDLSSAAAQARQRFEEAHTASRMKEALAFAQALQVLLDTKEWYAQIVPFIRSQPGSGLRLTMIASAEETLGQLEAAFDSYSEAIVTERLVGDTETLELAIDGLARVLSRWRVGRPCDRTKGK